MCISPNLPRPHGPLLPNPPPRSSHSRPEPGVREASERTVSQLLDWRASCYIGRGRLYPLLYRHKGDDNGESVCEAPAVFQAIAMCFTTICVLVCTYMGVHYRLRVLYRLMQFCKMCFIMVHAVNFTAVPCNCRSCCSGQLGLTVLESALMKYSSVPVLKQIRSAQISASLSIIEDYGSFFLQQQLHVTDISRILLVFESASAIGQAITIKNALSTNSNIMIQ